MRIDTKQVWQKDVVPLLRKSGITIGVPNHGKSYFAVYRNAAGTLWAGVRYLSGSRAMVDFYKGDCGC